MTYQVFDAQKELVIEHDDRCPLCRAAPELAESLAEMVDMSQRHLAGCAGPDDAAARLDRARDALAKAWVTP